MTHAGSTPTLAVATTFPIVPEEGFRVRMETALLPINPTATSVPSLLNEKCLGADPPAAAICTHCKDPSGIGLNVTSESDGPLGVSTDWSQRFDTVINFLSGCNFCDQASVVGQISNWGVGNVPREQFQRRNWGPWACRPEDCWRGRPCEKPCYYWRDSRRGSL